jgi:hypothetical protein
LTRFFTRAVTRPVKIFWPMGWPGPNPFTQLAQPAPTRGRRKTHLKNPLKKKPLKTSRATALTPVSLSKKLPDFGNWTWDPTLPVLRKSSSKLCCFDLGPWWSKLESRAGYCSVWRLSSWKHKFTGLSPKRRFLELAMWGLRSSSRNLATFQKGHWGSHFFL